MQTARAHAVRPNPLEEKKSSRNLLLARLPAEERERVVSRLAFKHFEPGKVLLEPGDTVPGPCFIYEGAVSQLAVLPDGKSQYSTIIGRDGALGLASGLGPATAFCRTIVLTSLTAGVMSAEEFSKLARDSTSLQFLIASYGDLLLAQSQQALVCNSAHHLQERLCRWLLHARDAVGSDTLQLTQQFLSQIAGVQRTSVNLVLGTLQADGLLSVQRGRVHLRHVERLQRLSCCCYAAARRLTMMPALEGIKGAAFRTGAGTAS
jgi:CRP-like cAMP-binding protein